VCKTCRDVSYLKFSNLPCLRYKITDIKMFEVGNIPGCEWTQRWSKSKFEGISSWASSELRTIQVTQGHSPRGFTLVVRKFNPLPGDSLRRSWVHGTIKKSVLIPPYAIADMEAATQTYKDFINQEGLEYFHSILKPSEKLIWGTYNQAICASNHAMVSHNLVVVFYFSWKILIWTD